MRSMIILGVAALAIATAHAQVKGQTVTRANSLTAPKSELQVTTTNNVYRSLKNPNITYSGVVVQAVKSRNPLQLINPLAPANQGSSEANTVRDPITGRSEGLKLFSIAFW
jgi:hypothetical protein